MCERAPVPTPARSAAEDAVIPPACPRSSSARPSRRLACVPAPTTSSILIHPSPFPSNPFSFALKPSHLDLAHSCRNSLARVKLRSRVSQAPREGVVVLTKASADEPSAYPHPSSHTPRPVSHRDGWQWHQYRHRTHTLDRCTTPSRLGRTSVRPERRIWTRWDT
jgi:hypothetical protein